MTGASLKDVAARAGVSFQTTGKVLNGKGAVSAQTRERILRAAADLGYVPNALARGLITRSTCTLGVMASAASDTVLSLCIAHVERAARAHGRSVIVGSIAPDGADGPAVARSLLERRVDGILVVAPQLEADAATEAVVAGNVPMVAVHAMPGAVSTVQGDFRQAAALAAEHLAALGHRRVATVTGPLRGDLAGARLDGFRAALAAAGATCPPALIEEADWEIAGGFRATQRLLDRGAPFTALYAQNDLMAIGALNALHERGLRVPDDCSLAGCDDLDIAAWTIPSLTTVRFPLPELAERAVAVLLEAIAAPPPAPRHEVLSMDLVVRRSTVAPSVEGAVDRTAGVVGDQDRLGD